MNKSLVYIIIAIVVIGGAFFLFSDTEDTDVPIDEATLGDVFSGVIEMSKDGFSPQEVTIEEGDTIRFLSVDEETLWPASNIHPTHTNYPGSSIQKCDTDEAEAIFDSCGPIAASAFWEFTFTEAGEWNYHDHLAPSRKGTIIVTAVVDEAPDEE